MRPVVTEILYAKHDISKQDMVRLRVRYADNEWPFDWWMSRGEWATLKAQVDNAFPDPPALDLVR